MNADRTVHASSDGAPKVEVVRYDRQGRWYAEYISGGLTTKKRLSTVHDAAQFALDLEARGGTIHTGRPGGKQFDTKVAGARQRQSRGVRR